MSNDTFPQRVAAEVGKARSKHRGMRCWHEAYAVIKEEFDEFWEEVKKRHFDAASAVKELVQVAAMCQRAAEDLQAVEVSDPDQRQVELREVLDYAIRGGYGGEYCAVGGACQCVRCKAHRLRYFLCP